MGDLFVSTLFGTAQIQSVATSAETQATSARPLPPAIAQLPQGGTLTGFVVNRTDQNHPILRTSYGDVSIKSDVFLKTGSEVALRISQHSGQVSAQIISVDSVPLKTIIQQQQASLIKTDQLQSSTLTVQGSQPSSSTAPVIQAVALQLAQLGDDAQSLQTLASVLRVPVTNVNALEQGAALALRIVSVAPPSGSVLAQTANAGSASPATLTPTAAATTSPANTASNTATQAPYQAYSQASANASGAGPTPTPAPSHSTSAPAHAAPVQLSASVIGHEGNASIVRSVVGTLKLFTPSALPTGSTLQLQLVPSTPAAPSAAATIGTANTTATSTQQRLQVASQLGSQWDSLEQAHHHLLQTAPASQAQEFTGRIPNTKSELVNHVLFFLSALRGNDLPRLLGQQNLQVLEERSPKLLQRLSADVASLSRTLNDQPDTNWQMLFFPLMFEDEMQQARLYVRRDNDEQNAQAEPDETRFVLEVTLSQLGELQIDGLMHGSRAQKLFDVTLRSQHPFADSMQDELRQLYRSAAEAVGFQGQLRFSSGKGSLLTPLQDIRNSATDDDSSILA